MTPRTTVPELLTTDPESGEARLVGGYSPTSGRHHFPLAAVCPYSGADDVERRVLSQEGTLWASTVVTAAPPGYAGPVPYGFGVVELPEGIRIITRIIGSDPTAFHLGQTLHLVVEELPTEDDAEALEMYAFTP